MFEKIEDLARDIIDIREYDYNMRCKYISELITRYYIYIQNDKDHLYKIHKLLDDIKDALNSNMRDAKIADKIVNVSFKFDNLIFCNIAMKHVVSGLGRAIRYDAKHSDLVQILNIIDVLKHILYSIRTEDTMGYKK